MANNLKNWQYIDVAALAGVLNGSLPQTTAILMEREPGPVGQIISHSYVAFDPTTGKPRRSKGGRIRLNTKHTRERFESQQLAEVLVPEQENLLEADDIDRLFPQAEVTRPFRRW